MLGRSHVVSGLAGASLILTLTDLSNRPEVAATTVALVAGAAILPDIDHPGTTISRSLPPVTRVLSRVISAVSGGHRKGTHAIIGWLAFGLLAFLLASWKWTVPEFVVGPFGLPSSTVSLGLGLVAGFLAGIALTALDLDPGGVPGWVVALVMGGIAATAHIDPIVVGALVSAGCAIHVVLGDGLTPKGVRYLYPFAKTRFRFPILGKAGSQRENLYVTFLGIVALVAPFFERIVVPWMQTF
ncbi:MAG: metal-dependent hydrolase [Ancrocorticia sp.]